MKKIHLYGPAVRNNRVYADAGVTLTVGDKPDEISAARAKKLLDSGEAVAEPVGKAD
jgi:hypothetical protein